jgi:hypothetical protein
MVRDAYANYVVQTTLDVLPDTEGRKLLLEELGAHVEELVSCWLPGWQVHFARLFAGLTRRPILSRRLLSAAQLYVRKAHCNEIECLKQRVRPTVSKMTTATTEKHLHKETSQYACRLKAEKLLYEQRLVPSVKNAQD